MRAFQQRPSLICHHLPGHQGPAWFPLDLSDDLNVRWAGGVHVSCAVCYVCACMCGTCRDGVLCVCACVAISPFSVRKGTPQP